jgi:tetratricopeptide (TPR) repeat protein
MTEGRERVAAMEWGVLLLAALAFRLAYLWQWEGSILAEVAVGEAARNLGLASGDGWYSRLYAGLCATMAGEASGIWMIRLVQTGIGALSCVLVWSIGTKLFSLGVGRGAGAAATLYGPAIYYGAELTPASLAVFLGLLLLWGLSHVHKRAVWSLAALGVVGGAVALLDFRGLILLAAIWGWLVRARVGDLAGGWFLAGAAAVLVPAAALWGWETILPATIGWGALQMIERVGLFWHGAEMLSDIDPYRAAAPSWLLAPLMWKTGVWFPFGLLAPLAVVGAIAAWRGAYVGRGSSLPLLFACAWMVGSMAGEISGRSRWSAAFFVLPSAVAAVPLLAGRRRNALGPRPAWALLVPLLLAVNLPVEVAAVQASHDTWMGYAYRQLGMEASAIASYERATASAEAGRQAYEELADLHFQAGAYASAADVYRELIVAHEGDRASKMAMAESYLRAGRADRAEVVFAELAEHEPWMVGRLGDARAMQGNLEEAIAAYQHVLTTWPDSHRVRFNLAQVWETTSQLDSAAAHYGVLAGVEVWGGEAGWRLAKVMGRMERDNLGQIEGVLRAVLERHPDTPPAALCLAGLLHRTGRDAGALSYLQALSKRSPDDYRVYGLMARVYEAMGRDAEAAKADEFYRKKRRHQQVDRRVRGDLEAMLQIVSGS